MRIFAALFCVFALLIAPAAAQTTPKESGEAAAQGVKLPDPLTPEAIRNLVSTISDAEARKLLVEVLDGLAKKAPNAQATPPSSGPATIIREVVSGVSDSISEMAMRSPRFITGLVEGGRNFVRVHGWRDILLAFGVMLLALGAAAGAERLVNAYAATWRSRIDGTREPSSLIEMFMLLGMRLVLDLGGLFAFF
ncbi:MAG TPA: hypothetical protein VLQ68_12030, partial [Rhizobiaceae bacterium]|nr:hypothetical protein [Rhizobiaceae bacterium]